MRGRRGIAASAAAVVAVATIATGIAVTNGQQSHNASPSAPSGSPTPIDVPPDPQSSRLDAANKALGDPEKLPWVMATGGVVTDNYENAAIDLPTDDYRLFVYCAGPGTVDVVVKSGRFGDTTLAAGKVTCAETPVPGQLNPGDYLASFACAGPGTVSFIIRSAPVLRDGTVSTEGQTVNASSPLCAPPPGRVTKDVAMSLPAGSAFTITAEADAAARNKAGWAYDFRKA